jgi:hypothetical protein
MTARKAVCRYGAIDERAAAGFAGALLHHEVGHGLPTREDPPKPLMRRLRSMIALANMCAFSARFRQLERRLDQKFANRRMLW